MVSACRLFIQNEHMVQNVLEVEVAHGKAHGRAHGKGE